MRVEAIVTVPPYASFIEEVARHPIVVGLRLNTVMPIQGPPGPVLSRLSSFGKPVWVDLKGRQLRVVGAAIPPFTEVRVSHNVRLKTPADAFFDDGREHARIVAVDGDRLILEDGPRRLIGPGESVNVVDPTLEIEGTLTETDRAYLDAMKALGMKRVMLSFVEKASDAAEVREALPGAEVVLKIESLRGLDLIGSAPASWKPGRLMAARGDLYVEVVRPHRILGALGRIIAADPSAIAASRIFPSLARQEVPDSPDVSDAALLMMLGYRTFMLGDEVCLKRGSVMSALNLLEAVAAELD